MKRICIDIDGTLLNSILRDGEYSIINANTDMIRKINKLYDHGATIIIYTGRGWHQFEKTRDQLIEHGIKYHSLVMGKPDADIFIDDKGVKPDEFLGR